MLAVLAGTAVMYAGGASSAALAAAIWSAPAPIGSTDLTSISCASSTFCAAVDASGNAASYDGTWGAFASIDPTALTSISCASATFCAAVDASGNAATYHGTTWGTFASTGLTGTTSISCTSATFCAAVDANGNAATYDGSIWTVDAIVDPTNDLTSVSCTSSTFCAAVDANGNAATYDGSIWTLHANVDSTNNLTSISCASATFCAAVDADGNAATFDGTTWTAFAEIDSTNNLTSVSCASSTFCAAVDAAGKAATFTGSGWSAPSSIDGTTVMTAVSCAESTFCVAVDHGGSALVWAVPPIPTNTALPGISGTPQQGDVLSELRGAWTSSPGAFSLQWQVCDASGAACIPIAGQTAPTYTLTGADVGRTIRVQESATNAGGTSVPVSSHATATVTSVPPPARPANTALPTIGGSPAVASTLTESHGAWTNNPTAFSLQWERCGADGAGCVPIAGQTGPTYRLTGPDTGHTIRVQESATNAGGTGAPATSAPTTRVTLSAKQIVRGLANQIAPSALTISLSSLVPGRSLSIPFTALAPGTVDLRWITGARAGGRAAASPAIVVASGKLHFRAAGTRALRLRLSAPGAQLLRARRLVTLRARGDFTPVGQAPLSASTTFVARHAAAIGHQLGVYRIPTPHAGPTAIAGGPAGGIWFTEWAIGKLAAVSRSGVVVERAVGKAHANPWGLALGSDHAMWFTDKGTNSIGRVAPGGAIAEYPIGSTPQAEPTSIAPGPSRTMRFTESNADAIGSIDTSTHAITHAALPAGSRTPLGLVSDGAGNDYFSAVEAHSQRLLIGEITASGAITTHTLEPGSSTGSYPGSIGLARGRSGQAVVYLLDDGNRAVVAYDFLTHKARYFSYPPRSQYGQGLTVAADGTVWYTTQKSGTVDRLVPATGRTFAYPTKPASVQPDGIVQGAAGSIWFLDWILGRVYKVAAGRCGAALCLTAAGAG